MVKKKRGKQVKKINNSNRLKNKISLVINQLLLFFGAGIVFLILYNFVNNGLLKDLFFILAISSGFIAVGFLIALLILFIIKIIKKK